MPALLREHTVCLSANKHQVRETKMRRSHRIPRREMRQRKKERKNTKPNIAVFVFVCLSVWELLAGVSLVAVVAVLYY